MFSQTEEISLDPWANGNEATFAEIYNLYFTRVYNYVRYRVDDMHAVDDLTSEIFEKLFTGLKYYQPEKAPFSAWLFSIARHRITDYYRRRGRHSFASLEVSTDLVCSGLAPDQSLIAAEMQQHIHKALTSLGEREREIIALKFWGGFTNRDIARVTGISESNTGVILYRSMRRLRQILESQGININDGC